MIVIVLLFIITGLTVIFISDFYSAYRNNFSDSIYGETSRSPLYGTKAFDAEATGFAIKKERLMEAIANAEFYAKNAVPVYDTTSPGKKDTQDASNNGISSGNSGSSCSMNQEQNEAARLYVVYSESLVESGGI